MTRIVNEIVRESPSDAKRAALERLAGETIGSEQAAAILKLSSVRVQKFARDGRIPGVYVFNSWRFFREDVLAFEKIERRPGRPADR